MLMPMMMLMLTMLILIADNQGIVSDSESSPHYR